ncbi:PTS system fructose subfamily IIA component [Solidesulfovibrio carbinoliphilus subsp. oakridgensis]|uniref:PTS system fructose subfamily IIA component n=1 Tax=Solidesulfovibrio carbinoliphilus subsp. oakridgensis TaxID=694327 RepID=G7Q480_9BACT|nr:PTS sugar transporter subunit IIA [Solidesulfovibrio carbinoliphilus]EHJ46948.1 PTS system fructose subfamily IIA component [Solidesulfovibrio carbinoliphilus subsp. oakridgensis]
MTNVQSRSDAPVGVVVVTHTDYGAWLLKAAEFILGPQERCRCVSVDMTHPVDETLVTLKAAIKDTEQGGGVLILTDMFGGTPTNLSLSLLGTGRLEVLTGVNLPMLIKILGSRTKALETLAVEAKQAGCQGIVVAGEVLRKKVAEG